MFTLKFFDHNGDSLSIACPKYEVFWVSEVIRHIIVYKELSGDGVLYSLGPIQTETDVVHKNWAALYVTNESGKTIDTVKIPTNIPLESPTVACG